jgi:hypothetical protein
VALGVVGPADPDAHAGRHRVGGAGVDGVQDRGVGAVEQDERERERPVQWLVDDGGGDPRPGLHGAGLADLDEVGGRLVADGVVLGGWDEHSTVGGPRPEDGAVTQTGHEPREDRAQRTGVVELHLQGCAQGA